MSTWWLDLDMVLDKPVVDVLAELQARNEALAARRALAFGRIAEYGTEADEREAQAEFDLIEIDQAGVDAWLDAAARDFDLEQGA